MLSLASKEKEADNVYNVMIVNRSNHEIRLYGMKTTLSHSAFIVRNIIYMNSVQMSVPPKGEQISCSFKAYLNLPVIEAL